MADGRKRSRSVEDDDTDLPLPPMSVSDTQSGRARIVKRQRVMSYRYASINNTSSSIHSNQCNSEILHLGDVVFVWRPLGYKHYGMLALSHILIPYLFDM